VERRREKVHQELLATVSPEAVTEAQFIKLQRSKEISKIITFGQSIKCVQFRKLILQSRVSIYTLFEQIEYLGLNPLKDIF